MPYRTTIALFVLTAGLGGCALFAPPLVYPPESTFTTTCSSTTSFDTSSCTRSARDHCAKEPITQRMTSMQAFPPSESQTTNHTVEWYCPP